MFSFSSKPPPVPDMSLQEVFKEFIENEFVTKNFRNPLSISMGEIAEWQPHIKRIINAVELVKKAGNGDTKAMKSLLEGELYFLIEYCYAQVNHSSFKNTDLRKRVPEADLSTYDGLTVLNQKLKQENEVQQQQYNLHPTLAANQHTMQIGSEAHGAEMTHLTEENAAISKVSATVISAILNILRRKCNETLSKNPRYSISKEIDGMDAASGVIKILNLYLKKGGGVFQMHSHNDAAERIKAKIEALYKEKLGGHSPTPERVEEVLQEELNKFFKEKGPDKINFKGDFIKTIIKAQIFLDKKIHPAPEQEARGRLNK